MLRSTRWLLAGTFTFAAFALLFITGGNAQDKKRPSERHDAAVLNQTLREVITAGAKLFNDHGDHAGCYRLWQGSLMSIRPFVPPDMQKSIDKGLASAEKLDTYADRAFELRKVIDDIRDKTRSPEEKKKDDKKKDDKKKDDKKKDDKKDDKKKDDKKDEKKKKKGDDKEGGAKGKGQVAGRLSLDGKPITGGYFVTLVGPKKFSSAVQKDGAFQFKTPIPAGEYRIAIEPIPGEKLKGPALPKRYQSAETSGLSIQIQDGKQQIDLNLVK